MELGNLLALQAQIRQHHDAKVLEKTTFYGLKVADMDRQTLEAYVCFLIKHCDLGLRIVFDDVK